jgi:hypothetical protein
MSKPNEQDFNLVIDGLSYWATTLNRVAARLALGRIKQALKDAAPEPPSAEAPHAEKKAQGTVIHEQA